MSLSIKNNMSGSGSDEQLKIYNLRQVDKTNTSITIKYIAVDNENIPLQHFIILNGSKKEITSDVGANEINREFFYTITGLTVGTKYDIQIEISNGSDITQSNILSSSTNNVINYGIRVNENNSNPSTCCEYIDDAVGISPSTQTSLGGWSDKWPFDSIKIVGLKNGKETKEINHKNKTQYIDGSIIPPDVDVMVKIPKIYWKFTKITNGYELRISNAKIEGSDCYAHKVGGVEKDYIYIGAYLGFNEGGKLRSKSGTLPTSNQTIKIFRQQAQANGSGYQQFNWFTTLLLQILYLIAYKNLNSQNALGMGLCNSSSKINTGGANTKGFVYGETNGNQQMCFLGIEDLWGNLRQWVDGIKLNNYTLTLTSDNKMFDENKYKSIGTFINKTIYGSISKVAHTNESGFLPIECNGSNTTYYSDYGRINPNSFCIFGGSYGVGLSSGIFDIYINFDNSASIDTLGSRLCYLG